MALGDWNRTLEKQRVAYLEREKQKRIAAGLAEQARVYEKPNSVFADLPKG